MKEIQVAAAKLAQPKLTTRPKGASAEFGSVEFGLKRHVSPHGQVTAVSMMKDEGPFVIEWVAHHLAVGFTDLLVYTNDCSDGTDDMLIRLELLGLVHHRRNVIPEGLRPQPSALNFAQSEPVVMQSDWVMVFDADEFVSIRHGDGRLDGMIGAAKAQGANGIVVTWRIFGSGRVVDWSRAPVTEQYLMAAPPNWNKGWGVKTLFQFDPEYWKLGIHRPKMKTRHIKTDFPDKVKWLNGSGAEMADYFKFRGWRSVQRTVGYDWVQLNHYAVKSVESYAIRKLRGNVNNKADKYNSDYWALQDRNEVRDDTMLGCSAARNRIIEQLLGDPELNRLHFKAVEGVEARLVELRKTQSYQTFVADLALASTVPITQIVAAPPQARDKEKIASLMSDVEKSRSAAAKALRKSDPQTSLESVPFGSYVTQAHRVGAAGPVAWVRNHSVDLPLDPMVFTTAALELIRNSKFERGLARRMPLMIDKGSRVLEIGAAVGFLASHLAHIRPDLHLIVQEDDPILLAALLQITAQNRREIGARFALWKASLGAEPAQAFSELIDAARPDVLMLADPRLSPEVVCGVLNGLGLPPPRQIFFYGRMLEKWHQDFGVVETLINRLGYSAQEGFDPSVARSFRFAGQGDEGQE